MQSKLSNVQSSLSPVGQAHILKFYNELDFKYQNELLQSIKQIDFEKLSKYFAVADHYAKTNIITPGDVRPPNAMEYESSSRCTKQQLEKYRELGLEAISRGDVAVMLVENEITPKGLDGMFYPGLPSGKSLFQIQAEQICKLQEMASSLTGREGIITWYILCFPHKLKTFEQFFHKQGYFGLKSNNVVFFEQKMLPCLSNSGKALLLEKHQLLMDTDGSGGVYEAILSNLLLEDMLKRKIKYVTTYSTENILVKIGDPTYLGYCLTEETDSAAKVVSKDKDVLKNEVVCVINDKLTIVPVDLLPPELVFLKNEDKSELVYHFNNIANYFMTTKFLKHIITHHIHTLPYHPTRYAYDFLDKNGKLSKSSSKRVIVLKKYIFDAFEYGDKFVVWHCDHKLEYSLLPFSGAVMKYQYANPLKDYYQRNMMWVNNAGGKVEGNVVEVSPLLSYEGEDLRPYVNGQSFQAPVILSSPKEKAPRKSKQSVS